MTTEKSANNDEHKITSSVRINRIIIYNKNPILCTLGILIDFRIKGKKTAAYPNKIPAAATGTHLTDLVYIPQIRSSKTTEPAVVAKKNRNFFPSP